MTPFALTDSCFNIVFCFIFFLSITITLINYNQHEYNTHIYTHSGMHDILFFFNPYFYSHSYSYSWFIYCPIPSRTLPYHTALNRNVLYRTTGLGSLEHKRKRHWISHSCYHLLSLLSCQLSPRTQPLFGGLTQWPWPGVTPLPSLNPRQKEKRRVQCQNSSVRVLKLSTTVQGKKEEKENKGKEWKERKGKERKEMKGRASFSNFWLLLLIADIQSNPFYIFYYNYFF